MVGSVHNNFISQLKQLVLTLEQEETTTEDILVPATIFSFSQSPLQSLVTYLKDTYNFSFKEIATKLQRAYATIYAAYKTPLHAIPPTRHVILLATFATRMSVLETCVVNLKEEQHLKLSEIARLLKKDPRTIWSTYDRAKKKHDKTRN